MNATTDPVFGAGETVFRMRLLEAPLVVKLSISRWNVYGVVIAGASRSHQEGET